MAQGVNPYAISEPCPYFVALFMWIAFALLSAVSAAGTSVSLKRTVAHGGVVVTTIAFRVVAGLVLAAVVFSAGPWPTPTPGYWRAVALVIPPEVAGMVFMTLALRSGELSLVQPLLGLLPLLVMAGGFIFLNETPTLWAGAGVLFVTAGVYCVGLQPGGSLLEPLRALVRSRASWYAVAAAFFWSFATVVHKLGIAAVGAFPWAVTLTIGSALVLALSLPVLVWRNGSTGVPARIGPWAGMVALTGIFFAAQQTGLHLALGASQAGYVAAVNATSILIATALGILLLGERSAARNRIAGGMLVSSGAILIALFG